MYRIHKSVYPIMLNAWVTVWMHFKVERASKIVLEATGGRKSLFTIHLPTQSASQSKYTSSPALRDPSVVLSDIVIWSLVYFKPPKGHFKANYVLLIDVLVLVLQCTDRLIFHVLPMKIWKNTLKSRII